jgi:hypothetical protein
MLFFVQTNLGAKTMSELNLSSTKTLNNGEKMSYIGLGVWQSRKGTTQAVKWAIEAG